MTAESDHSPALAWRKSSASQGLNDCVEVAARRRTVYVRNSRDPLGPSLTVGPAAWRSLLRGVRAEA